jgi:hypothetical protein
LWLLKEGSLVEGSIKFGEGSPREHFYLFLKEVNGEVLYGSTQVSCGNVHVDSTAATGPSAGQGNEDRDYDIETLSKPQSLDGHLFVTAF